MFRKNITIAVTILTLLALFTINGLADGNLGTQEYIFDDFEDGNVSDWSFGGANGVIEAVTSPVSPSGGDYVGKVTFAGSCYGPGKRIDDPVTPDYISLFFRADGDTAHPAGMGYFPYSLDGYVALLTYHNGYLRYGIGSGTGVYPNIMPASMGTWYQVELKNIDWDGNTYDIWVDGEHKVSGAPFFHRDADDFDRIHTYACPWANGPIYLDDIKYGSYFPTVDPISAPVDPVQAGITIHVSANFTNPGTASTHTALWDWGDETTSPGDVTESNGSGSIGGSHAYTNPGVYTLTLTVTDDNGDAGEALFQYVVVYDPNAGFVTGGGWIDSPPGAYQPDPLLTGKANFGFVSKYKKGASVPAGNTEFQFQAADLNFHSTSYDWLVVTGSDYARFKGMGTINGGGEYKFMLWAGDYDPDTFRIKIWWEEGETEHIVYDNGMDQEIGGGNIVIHTK